MNNVNNLYHLNSQDTYVILKTDEMNTADKELKVEALKDQPLIFMKLSNALYIPSNVEQVIVMVPNGKSPQVMILNIKVKQHFTTVVNCIFRFVSVLRVRLSICRSLKRYKNINLELQCITGWLEYDIISYYPSTAMYRNKHDISPNYF